MPKSKTKVKREFKIEQKGRKSVTTLAIFFQSILKFAEGQNQQAVFTDPAIG